MLFFPVTSKSILRSGAQLRSPVWICRAKSTREIADWFSVVEAQPSNVTVPIEFLNHTLDLLSTSHSASTTQQNIDSFPRTKPCKHGNVAGIYQISWFVKTGEQKHDVRSSPDMLVLLFSIGNPNSSVGWILPVFPSGSSGVTYEMLPFPDPLSKKSNPQCSRTLWVWRDLLGTGD